MLIDDFGYIQVSKFGCIIYVELLNVIVLLNYKNCKGLIIDLCGNIGGYMEVVVCMVNEFLFEGKLIVYMEGCKYFCVDEFVNGIGSCQKMFVIVLIDEGLVLVSEIFIGVIQDND